ncbi:MAG: TetR/AcrR family transcriptional regulator [Spirochaetes bacterium]|nr:TetR/AcrR family transcriptional regulator [Spirochaetota bacterium]
MEKQTTKDKIKETARELFFKFGIKRVSVEEISEKAEISKVTFYKYYKNKMDLAVELRDELMEEGFTAFDEINKQEISFMDKINMMTQWQMEFYSQMNNEFVKEIVNLKDVEEEFRKRFIKNVKAGQKNGEVRSDLNLELVFLVSKKLQEITREGTWKELFSDYSEYIKQVRTIIFYGLLSRSDEKKKRIK